MTTRLCFLRPTPLRAILNLCVPIALMPVGVPTSQRAAGQVWSEAGQRVFRDQGHSL